MPKKFKPADEAAATKKAEEAVKRAEIEKVVAAYRAQRAVEEAARMVETASEASNEETKDNSTNEAEEGKMDGSLSTICSSSLNPRNSTFERAEVNIPPSSALAGTFSEDDWEFL